MVFTKLEFFKFPFLQGGNFLSGSGICVCACKRQCLSCSFFPVPSPVLSSWCLVNTCEILDGHIHHLNQVGDSEDPGKDLELPQIISLADISVTDLEAVSQIDLNISHDP